MSPNPNYLAGRRAEYARAKYWRDLKHTVMRTAGSHGPFDLLAISQAGTVLLIQIKRCQKKAQARRLIQQFKESPPLPDLVTNQFRQVIEVYCVEGREWTSATV